MTFLSVLAKPFSWTMLACLTVETVTPGVPQLAVDRTSYNRAMTFTAAIDTVAFATISTDTGALALGNKDFARFTTPTLCLLAAESAAETIRHSLSARMAHLFRADSAAGDTLPTGAVTIARTCGARFTVASTASDELSALFQLALMAKDDDRAQHILTRQLLLAKKPALQDHIRQEAIDAYLAAAPARIVEAESLTRHIDTASPAAYETRLTAHESLLHFAEQTWDLPRMQREAHQMIVASDSISPRALSPNITQHIEHAWIARLKLLYIEQPDSLVGVAGRVKQRFSELTDSTRSSAPPFNRWTAQQFLGWALPYSGAQYDGAPPPPMKATYWFPRAPTAWPPGHGRVSLVIYGGALPNQCVRNDYDILGTDVESVTHGLCGALYTYLPQWIAQYGDSLSVTLISQTQGHAVRSVTLSPAAEADSLNWFFHRYLKLPVTLGVVMDSIWRLPSVGVDGRRIYIDTAFYNGRLRGEHPSWNATNNMLVLFYDEHGTLRYVGQDGIFDAPLLQLLIARALRTI